MVLLLGLSFWLIPTQRKLYLKPDYEIIEGRAFTYFIWTLVVGTVTVLFLALRKVENL
jgi:hypothetical protein